VTGDDSLGETVHGGTIDRGTRVRRTARRLAPAAVVLLLQLVAFPMPLGAWLSGLVFGLVGSLAAVGLVLVWRSNRILNFAQGDLGGFPATLAVLLVTAGGLPWLAGVALGLVAAVVVGLVVDVVVVRRFFGAPRLLLTVATLGLSQVLGFCTLLLPRAWGLGPAVRTLPPPFEWSWEFGGVVFDASDLVAVVVAPVALVAVALLLGRTRTGTAVRAAADRSDRALSLGVPVRRLEAQVWILVTVLAYISMVLTAAVAALPFGVALGLAVVARSLAAFVLGRMDDFLAVGAAAVALGVLESGVRWNTGDVVVFAPILAGLVVAGLLVQRRGTSRADRNDSSSWQTVGEVRPVPAVLARLPEVRAAQWGLGMVTVLAATLLPLLLGTNGQIKLGIVVAFMVVGLSLVVLTGWAGQVSLGQMTFVGVGAAIGAWCTVNRGWDPLVAMAAAAAIGAVVAVLVGLPALRLRGLYLAVTTLALSLAASEWVFSNRAWRWIPVDPFDRPLLMGRVSIDSPLRIYYLALTVLAVVAWLLRGLRRSRTGRVLVALRDNETNVAAFGVSPTRAKLTAFAVSGAVAAVAGVVLVLAQSAFRPTTYGADESISVFVATVIGGPATLLGGAVGALFQRGSQWLLPTPWSFFATGAGVLVVLLVLPQGLGGVLWGLRDRFLRWAARRHGVTSLALDRTSAADPDAELNPPVDDVEVAP
jgi:branched-chain amino acid transport system permease protein